MSGISEKLIMGAMAITILAFGAVPLLSLLKVEEQTGSEVIIQNLVDSGCVPIVLKNNPEVKIIEFVCYYGEL